MGNKEIIKMIEDNGQNKLSMLKRQSTFISFLCRWYFNIIHLDERLVKPELIAKGPTYKYETTYKIYLHLINSTDFYNEIRKKFKVEKSSKKVIFKINYLFETF